MVEKYLYDRLDRKYDRKNLYLTELADLYLDGNKEKIKEFKQNKKSHPYIIKLSEFQKKEEAFLSELKSILKTEKDKTYLTKEIKELSLRYFEASKKESFYKDYIELCYEAEYEFKVSSLEIKDIPSTIEKLETFEKEIATQKELLEKIKSNSYDEVKQSLKDYKNKQKEYIREQVLGLKQKKKNGLISATAYQNAAKEIKRKCKEDYEVKTYELPSKLEKKKYSNLLYDRTAYFKQEKAYIDENISEIRRTVPFEGEVSIVSNLLFMFPGVGQILLGQKTKGLYMLLLSLFVYVVAVPYALGFGNYRGDGIAGIISLAEGAGKLDRSIIFLIEGIIAIFLIAIAAAIILFNRKDLLDVRKDKKRGIRPSNWYESKTKLSEEGFPFIVTLPALITVIFIVIVPITTSILLSFTSMDPDHQAKFQWIGLENYRMLVEGVGVAGGPFWRITFWTIIWTLCSTSLAVLIGFALALILNNDRIKFKRFFRSVFLLPWAVPAFITILFFSILFGAGGVLTEVLGGIQVKNSTTFARLTLILMQGWLGSAYVFLLSTGVLQSIPNDLYEAADIDGSTAWQKLRKITIPIILFQTAPLLVGQYVFNFNNFSIIYLFNGGGPYNPGIYGNIAGTTDLLISYVFKLTIEQQFQSIGAAIIFIVSLGLMFFAFLGFINSKAFKEEKL